MGIIPANFKLAWHSSYNKRAPLDINHLTMVRHYQKYGNSFIVASIYGVLLLIALASSL